jgi:hypothetical protein
MWLPPFHIYFQYTSDEFIFDLPDKISTITGASGRAYCVRLSIAIFDLLDQTAPGKFKVTP